MSKLEVKQNHLVASVILYQSFVFFHVCLGLGIVYLVLAHVQFLTGSTSKPHRCSLTLCKSTKSQCSFEQQLQFYHILRDVFLHICRLIAVKTLPISTFCLQKPFYLIQGVYLSLYFLYRQQHFYLCPLGRLSY